MINHLAFPPLLAAAISIYLALYHVFLAVNDNAERSAFAFSAFAFSTGVYQISCGMLYNATGYDTALFWQRMNFFGIACMGFTMTQYVYTQLSRKSDPVKKLISLWFMGIGIFCFVDTPLGLSAQSPQRDMTFAGVRIFEHLPGSVLTIHLLASIAIFIYLLYIQFTSNKGLEKFDNKLIFLSFTAFFILSLHDVFVAADLIDSFYTTEYGFLAVVLAITWSRSIHSLELHRTVKDLNKNLEKKVEDRTAALERARHEAEIANKTKSLFLANMSHDIRTPMNGILGFNQFLQSTNLSAEQSEYVSIIESSSKQLLNLLNDILDYTKIEAGQLTLENIPFSLNKVLEEAKWMFSLAAEKKGVQFNVMNNSSFNWVYGDPARYNQIVNNLLSNALKFTERGKINLAIGSNELGLLTITVSDTGIGIDASVQDTIFESFIQEDPSTTRKYGGTGLGLAITKQLVALMKGKISLTSTKNVGTTFTITIPVAPASPQEQKAHHHTAADKNKQNRQAKILLAEDNPINAMVARKFLESQGSTVEHVDNGRHAFEQSNKCRYDLIFLDIQMPELDGIETTKMIRQGSEMNRHTPIIAMTANAMIGDKERYLASGMTDYISKPFSKYDFQQILSRYTLQQQECENTI